EYVLFIPTRSLGDRLMWRRLIPCLCAPFVILGVLLVSPEQGRGGIFDHLHGNQGPPTLTEVARMIDRIQEPLLDQGTVVVKQPDIWSQARMTKFRKEFEDTMSPEVTKFKDYLSARIARSDAASFQSQTQLGAVLNPFGTPTGGTPFSGQITSQAELNSAMQ